MHYGLPLAPELAMSTPILLFLAPTPDHNVGQFVVALNDLKQAERSLSRCCSELQ